MRFLASFTLLLATGALLAQHTYTPADVEEGGRLYRSTCVTCHGENGDLASGVDLGSGQFRRGETDDDLIAIIRTGIAGTPMPPNSFTEFEAGTIVAYLRSLAGDGPNGAIIGDPARGAVLYSESGCASCHRIAGQGSLRGPDLSYIGASRRSAQLAESIRNPNAEIAAANRSYRVVTRGGTGIVGRLMNVDTYTVQLLDPQRGLLSLNKQDLAEYGFLDASPMPAPESLSGQDIADLVAYLSSLKGPG